MRKINAVLALGIWGASLFVTSCSSDDDSNTPIDTSDFAQGVLILNEGTMGNANASVSFLGNDGVLRNDIYQTVNGGILGDIAQSIYVQGDKAYIVLNGSGSIEVVDRYTFEKLGTVSSGLVNPRYMVIENGKGYVTNWGDPANPADDFVAVVNLANYSVESTIPVVEGPERMAESNGKIYVAHAGGWGTGNSISVINTSSNTISSTIPVGDIPNSIEIENGKIYVLCGGKPAWTQDETAGGLYEINANTLTITSQLMFSLTDHPSQMVEENGTIYYTIDGKIYKKDLNANSLPSNPLFEIADQGISGVYGFAVNNGKIYIGDAMDYASNGKVYVYTTTGTPLESFTVGKLPNGFAFN